MASENVELVRRGFEAAFQRPKPDFDTLNALFQAEHEHISAASRVDGGTSLRGAPAFREWLDNIEGAFELWTASTEEIRGLDDEHVLVTGELNAVGRRSGVPVKQDFVVVMTVRDGKISRTESFASREDALKAVRPDR